MSHLELIVDRQLRDGRFVVLNNSDCEIPLASTFDALQSRQGSRDGDGFNWLAVAPTKRVALTVSSIDSSAQTSESIPTGHNAAVKLEGIGIEHILQDLQDKQQGVYVFLYQAPVAEA